MTAEERMLRLLEEIRDAQQEHLAEYRRVTRQSLELQELAVGRQQQAAGLYRRVVVAGGVMVIVLLGLLAVLLQRWWGQLFP